MGAAVVADQTPATTAPESTPAPAPEAAPAAPESGAQPAGTESEPAPPPAAGEPAAPVPEHHVPWRRFKEVQTGFTTARRQWETKEQQYQREVAEAKAKYEALAPIERDYRAMEAVLRAHPDIADAIRERLGGQTPVRPGSSQAPLPPALIEGLKQIKDLAAGVEAAKQQQQRAAERAEYQRLKTELDGILKAELAKRKYPEKMLPIVRAYVKERADELGYEDFEDVPVLVSEWWRAMEEHRQGLNQGLVAAKTGDRAVLPPTPAGSAPLIPEPKKMSFDEAKQTMIAELEKRGWNNNGG